MEMKKMRGFTMVELLVVLAVLGLLVAIALPNYKNYRQRAKQTEARVNLKAIYIQELSYFAEKETYSPLFSELGWEPRGRCLYRYSVGSDFAGNPNPGGSPMNSDTPGADKTSFTAVGWGNLNEDAVIDTWAISSNYILKNTKNDAVQ